MNQEIIKIMSGSQVEVKLASWRDLTSIRELEKICFPRDAWPLWDMLGALTFPNTVPIKAEANGILVGFVAGDIRRHQKIGWIATICVAPEYRMQGLGKKLLRMCEFEMGMPIVRLSVRESNHVAIDMYLKYGYSKIGRWTKYYVGGEDGVVMEKRIKS